MIPFHRIRSKTPRLWKNLLCQSYRSDHIIQTPAAYVLAPTIYIGRPYPQERANNKKGRAYYLEPEAKITSLLHPGKLAELKEKEILDKEAGREGGYRVETKDLDGECRRAK
jgi:hypothetical protein